MNQVHPFVSAFLIGACMQLSAQADERVICNPVFGSGTHADWDPFFREENHVKALVSSLIKDDWEYKATYTTGELLEITRESKTTGKLEPLFDYNRYFPTAYGKILPARIVDVFEIPNTIAMLLAVPNGYIYVNITNDLNQIDADHFVVPPAGVGKNSWLVVKATRDPTTFGIPIPELGSGLPILGLEFDKVDRLMLILKDNEKPAGIRFTEDKILKDGLSLETTSSSGSLYHPSCQPILRLLQNIDRLDQSPEKAIHEWRSLIARTQGGRDWVVKEFKRKLTKNPEVWKKVQQLDQKAFDEP